MSKQPISINKVRELGKEAGASHVVVLQVYEDTGQFAVTSWGKTRHKCDQARQWADKRYTEILTGMLKSPHKEHVSKRVTEVAE